MTEKIARAEAFARQRHAGQTRKGAAREPYASHLAEVAEFVARHGGDEDAIAAAWLHDTVEDCPPTSHDEIAMLFGVVVAGVVREVTDDKALPKAERKARQLAGAAQKSARAALVKLGDKTSNVRSVAESGPVHWDLARSLAYLDWAADVVAALPEGNSAARKEFETVLAAARARLLAGAD